MINTIWNKNKHTPIFDGTHNENKVQSLHLIIRGFPTTIYWFSKIAWWIYSLLHCWLSSAFNPNIITYCFFLFSRFFFSIELLIRKADLWCFLLKWKRLKEFQKRNEKVIKIQHLLFLRIWKKIWTLSISSLVGKWFWSLTENFFSISHHKEKKSPLHWS